MMTSLDIGLLILFIACIVVWALRNARNKTVEDYFLAGKSSNWFLLGLSLFAASISLSTLIGHTGEGFISGIAVFNYNWISVLVLAFFALFFLPFYVKSGIYTMPEFLERRFDSRSRIYFSIVMIVGNIFLDAASCLYTGALILKQVFVEVDMMYIIIAIALVAGSYSIIGGVASSVKADLFFSAILIIGGVFLSVYCVREIGGWDVFYERFHHGVWLRLTRPISDPTVPWLGMIVGIPILGFYYWCNNQVMVQKVLSAKSIDHGRKGVLFVGFLYLLTLFVFIMPGLIARGLNLFGVELPDEVIPGNLLKMEYGINTDAVYPNLIFKILPTGAVGLMIATMIAALVSTLGATLNSVSTLITMDFYSKYGRKKSPRHLVKAGQISAVAALILAVVWAPMIQHFDSLVSYYQEIVSYLSPPIVGAFFLGLFWRRATSTGIFAGLLSGLASAGILMMVKYVFHLPVAIHFLLLAPILLLLSLLVMILVSLKTRPSAEATVRDNTWTAEIWHEETMQLKGVKWYRNYRIIVLILVLCCFVEYFCFF